MSCGECYRRENEMCTCIKYSWTVSSDGDSYRIHESECLTRLTRAKYLEMKKETLALKNTIHRLKLEEINRKLDIVEKTHEKMVQDIEKTEEEMEASIKMIETKTDMLEIVSKRPRDDTDAIDGSKNSQVTL